MLKCGARNVDSLFSNFGAVISKDGVTATQESGGGRGHVLQRKHEQSCLHQHGQSDRQIHHCESCKLGL